MVSSETPYFRYQGLMCFWILSIQPNMVSSEVPYFRTKDRLLPKCYIFYQKWSRRKLLISILKTDLHLR